MKTFEVVILIAQKLIISRFRNNDWVNRGLPSHKQRGRIYFDKTVVKGYIKTHKMEQLKFGTGFQKLRKEIA